MIAIFTHELRMPVADMPPPSRRQAGQRGRREREAKLPSSDKRVLLYEFSKTPAAIAARAARPREDGWEPEQVAARKKRKKRVQRLLTRYEADFSAAVRGNMATLSPTVDIHKRLFVFAWQHYLRVRTCQTLPYIKSSSGHGYKN